MSTTTANAPKFGKWRSFFWPIHTWELKKFIPMALMFFFINFNYTILRDTKDALIVTAPGSGAEAIPFLKLWGVLPFAILFMLLYSKLSNVFSKPKLFYTMISIFHELLCLLRPCSLSLTAMLLHPTVVADQLQAILPQGFSGLSCDLAQLDICPFLRHVRALGKRGPLPYYSGDLPTTQPAPPKQNGSMAFSELEPTLRC